jgi:hypothetical protein
MIMKGIAVLFGALVFAGCMQVSTVEAHEKEDFKNLKILDGANKKGLEAGMKSLSKGLGVKCNACHVKGEFDSDKIEAKSAARKFLNTTVGEKDGAKRDAALAELLSALKMDKPKDAKAVWAGVDGFKKK